MPKADRDISIFARDLIDTCPQMTLADCRHAYFGTINAATAIGAEAAHPRATDSARLLLEALFQKMHELAEHFALAAEKMVPTDAGEAGAKFEVLVDFHGRQCGDHTAAAEAAVRAIAQMRNLH